MRLPELWGGFTWSLPTARLHLMGLSDPGCEQGSPAGVKESFPSPQGRRTEYLNFILRGDV